METVKMALKIQQTRQNGIKILTFLKWYAY